MDWSRIQQVIDIRYARGFAHWDFSGRLANQISDLYPGMTVITGDPSQVTLRDDEQQVDLKYGVDGASVAAFPMRDSDPFHDYAEPFLNLVIKVFEIRSITRVGHRSIYHHPLKDKAEVLAYINDMGKKNGAGGSFFATSEDPRLSSKRLSAFSLTFEDEKIGIRLNIHPANTKINVNGPIAGDLRRHLPPASDVVVADIDISTLKPLQPPDLLINELIKSNTKMLKTRILPLLQV